MRVLSIRRDWVGRGWPEGGFRADRRSIEQVRRAPFSAFRRASARKRLWLGAAGVCLFLATLLAGQWAIPRPAPGPRWIGLDFIAFYTAGSFVREGRVDRMYDLEAVRRFQHDLALRNGVDIGQACGPWWNPPFYALPFVPLARLAYPAALGAWIAANVLCAAIAVWLMIGLLPKETGWKSWALVPALVVLSTPFIHALSHGQNTCTSLLILTATVILWRSQRALPAGLVGGLLFYKPQLGMIVAAVMVFDLGWRAALGYTVTGCGLLLATLVALPGTLAQFLRQVPRNLDLVQSHTVYLWERHVTFKAFWRLLLQGRGIGATTVAVEILTVSCMAAVAIALGWAALRAREGMPQSRDRLIAAAIVCSPLLMPFYFDYDQLLLAIPAVLLAAELMNRQSSRLPRVDRWLLILWPIYYVWLMLNPDVAEHTRLSLTVPLLAGIAALTIVRAGRAVSPWHRRVADSSGDSAPSARGFGQPYQPLCSRPAIRVEMQSRPLAEADN